MERYCVAKNKPMRRTITKSQGLPACPELYISSVHGFSEFDSKPLLGDNKDVKNLQFLP